ncbi:cell wall-associated hydrolase, invasion-associated protein [Actinobacteria bacterium IMCC26207]|nr:cell wall-associated hydrolase, invasion-associated protein [Actinobacteria bacterium IMCC26207]
MHSTTWTPSGLIRPLRTATVVIAAIVTVGLVTSSSNVGAQSVEGLREKAAKVAAELDALQEKSDQLNEEYLQTQEDISGLQQEQQANEQAVADAQVRLDRSRAQATGYLVEAYVGAGVQNQVAFGKANPNEAVNQQVLLELLQGDRVQLADGITADQQDLDVKNQQLKASGTQLEARKSQQAKVVSQLDSSVNRQQELLDSTKGELRAAVEAEQQRAAAAAAAAAAAKAQAVARAQQAAAARVAPSQAGSPAAKAPAVQAPRSARPSPAAAVSPPPETAAAPSQDPLPASAPNSAAGAAIAAAQSQLGTAYRYGGSSPGGFDCSGLMLWSWAQAGVSLPRTSGAQRGGTQRITREQLQPGDLVFYRNPVGHVGMYIGGGQMIHSPHTGDVVKISSIDRMGGSMSFGRVG